MAEPSVRDIGSILRSQAAVDFADVKLKEGSVGATS